MEAGLIERIETGAEKAASALLGAAVAYAVYVFLGLSAVEPRTVYAAAAGLAGYFLTGAMLRKGTRNEEAFRVPVFDLRDFDQFATGELLLTDRLQDELLLTERLDDELLLTDGEPIPAPGEPLVLDDVLAEIGPEARVVRLFDRKAMPSPGELKSRIDNHLGQGSAAAGSMDAAQALSEALAELKRSLR